MKKLVLIAMCVMVILSGMAVMGCKAKDKAAGTGLGQSLDNTDLIGPGKGKDFGFGPVGFDLDGLVQRLGPDAVKNLKIGVSVTSQYTQWVQDWVTELVNLGKTYGFGVVVMSAEDDILKQASDLKSMQSQQVDGIVTYAGHAQALAQTMTEVNSAGIPIVSCIGIDPAARISGYLSVSQKAKGAMMADQVARDAAGREFHIILSCASIEFPTLNDRRIGFAERVKEKYPNIKIDYRLAADSEVNFLDVIKEGLLANDRIEAVYGTFPWPVIAGYNAGKQLNRNLRIYGIDADEFLVQLMAEGDMIQGLHAQFAAANAYTTLFLLFRVLAGEKIPYETMEADSYAMLYVTQKDAPLVMKLLYGK